MEQDIYSDQLFLMWWGVHKDNLLNDIKEIQRQAKEAKDTFPLEQFPAYIATYLDSVKGNLTIALLVKYGWEFPQALTHELRLLHGKELNI